MEMVISVVPSLWRKSTLNRDGKAANSAATNIVPSAT